MDHVDSPVIAHEHAQHVPYCMDVLFPSQIHSQTMRLSACPTDASLLRLPLSPCCPWLMVLHHNVLCAVLKQGCKRKASTYAWSAGNNLSSTRSQPPYYVCGAVSWQRCDSGAQGNTQLMLLSAQDSAHLVRRSMQGDSAA